VLQAISLDPRKVDVAKAMQAVSVFGPRGEGGGANFVVGDTFHSVQRSKYGKRLAQNMTREVRPARNLVNAAGRCFQGLDESSLDHFTVDPAIKKRIDDRIAAARNALKDLEKESADLAKEDSAIQAEEAKFQKKMVSYGSHKLHI